MAVLFVPVVLYIPVPAVSAMTHTIWREMFDSAQTSKHLLKEVLGRMFPAIYNFSIFSIRDFDGQVATVNCS